MNRTEKNAQISDMSQTFSAAQCVYLVNLAGLTVPQVTDLRRKIKAAKGSCQVVKNRLAIRAIQGTAFEALVPHFRGPIGIVVHPQEAVGLAKVVSDFAKDHPGFGLGHGLAVGQVLSPEQIKRLATLPGLDELRATLLAAISAPAASLVRILAAPGQQVARALDERHKQLGESIN